MNGAAERRLSDIRADLAAISARIERLSAERDHFLQPEIDALTEARKNLLKELEETCKR